MMLLALATPSFTLPTTSIRLGRRPQCAKREPKSLLRLSMVVETLCSSFFLDVADQILSRHLTTNQYLLSETGIFNLPVHGHVDEPSRGEQDDVVDGDDDERLVAGVIV